MNLPYRKFYILTLAVLIGLSAYPIYMGFITLMAYMRTGFIDAADYPKYIIPYTPLSLSLIFTTALMPLIFKLTKKRVFLVASLIGTVLFFIGEIGLEQIKVVEGYTELPLDSWQYSLCIATPETLRAIGEPIYAENNPAYKVHFYLIALLILYAVINIVYEFAIMVREKNFEKKHPVFLQLAATTVFIGLCVLACFTAFYRNGTINISPLSAALMTLFFIAFGVTAGTLLGCIMYKRKKLFSVIIPAAASSATTLAMYIGELFLMGGELFRFGISWVFKPLSPLPFAVFDIVTILLSGVISYFIMLKAVYRRNKKND